MNLVYDRVVVPICDRTQCCGVGCHAIFGELSVRFSFIKEVKKCNGISLKLLPFHLDLLAVLVSTVVYGHWLVSRGQQESLPRKQSAERTILSPGLSVDSVVVLH